MGAHTQWVAAQVAPGFAVALWFLLGTATAAQHTSQGNTTKPGREALQGLPRRQAAGGKQAAVWPCDGP
jgi:hypothetical protein